MANTIRNKRGTTKPAASDLVTGEIAIKTDDAKLFIENDSGHVFEVGETLGTFNSSTITYTVTVASKTSAHRYNGTGSGSGYKINGIFAPFLSLTPGNTYKFDQADSSNSGHPLRFYLEADKTTAYTTNVTTSGTPGSSGAYTQIVITDATPIVLHYQCSAHAYMGNSVTSNGTSIDGSNITSGTIPDARFPATLPAVSGANLTNLPSGGLSSDAQENTVGGTNAGDSFTGTDAAGDTLIGYNAGTAITSGDHNTALGAQALESLTTGYEHVAIGYQASKSIVTGNISVAIGNEALKNATAGFNEAIGNSALLSCTSGEINCVVGSNGLGSLTTGSRNVSFGRNSGNALTTGQRNTFIGENAGDTATTGSRNICLGNNATPSSATVSNEVTVGDTNITKFRIPGINFTVKDSTATEDYVLTVDANGECGWEAAAGGGLSSDAQMNTVGGTNAGDSFTGTDANGNTLIGYDAGFLDSSNFWRLQYCLWSKG